MSNKISINEVLIFILAAMTFILGLFISDLQNKIGSINLYNAVFIFLLCFVVCFIFFIFISKKLSTYIISGSKIHFCGNCNKKDIKIGKLTTILNQCKSKIDKLYSEMPHYAFINKDIIIPGVLTAQELANIELELPSNSKVWLMTETLKGDTPGKLFHTVAEKNFEKGIDYTFFIPKRSTLDGDIKMIHDGHSKFKDKFRFIIVPEDFFLLYPDLDLAIFSPLISDKSCAYMQIPTQIDSDEVFYISLDNKRYINAIIKRLELIIKIKNGNNKKVK